jgi:hypothetical protein
MPISVTCPSCAAKLQAPEAAVGRKVKCPKCQTPVPVQAGKGAALTAKASAAKPSAVKAVAAKPPPSKTAPTRPTKAAPVEPAVPSVEDAGEGAAWERSTLLQHNEWTFKEQGWLRINVKNRHFQLYKAATKDIIGYADEKASGFFLALRALNNLGKWLPTTVEVRDEPDGPLLLSIRKINIPLLPWTDIEIYDDQRQKLGYFRTKIFSLLGGFWLYDAEGKEVAEVKAKLGMPPRYLFLTKDGRELGSVGNEAVTKAAESKKVQFTVTVGRPSLRLKVAPEMENELKIKALMLATVLAFEFTGVGDKLLQ